jgi:hypothetical protein
MSAMQIQFHPTPDDDTAAAILAAVACYAAPDPAATAAIHPQASAWRTAGQLAAQGLPAARAAAPPSWASADRTSRAARWSAGIVGM